MRFTPFPAFHLQPSTPDPSLPGRHIRRRPVCELSPDRPLSGGCPALSTGALGYTSHRRASFVMDHGRYGPQGALGGEDGAPNEVEVWRGGEMYIPEHLS